MMPSITRYLMLLVTATIITEFIMTLRRNYSLAVLNKERD
jgi:hypothetical protein